MVFYSFLFYIFLNIYFLSFNKYFNSLILILIIYNIKDIKYIFNNFFINLS